jgi:hypothetical protein
MPQATQHRRPAPKQQQKPQQPAAWRERAMALVIDAHNLLWESDSATEYLRRRGLESHTWLTYQLGYIERSPTAERAPAIVLPWYRAGQIAAVRFRFLDVQKTVDKQGAHHATKLKALQGSQFSGLLFGGQAEPLPHSQRTLVLCEGEVNAASIWQVAHESRLDVLSIGSESARLSPAMLKLAGQYGSVLVWADRAEVAKQQAKEIGAYAVSSPGGSDANDLLQDGSLGYALSFWRYEMAQTAEQREALLWALVDASNTLLGVDDGTAKLIDKLREERQ